MLIGYNNDVQYRGKVFHIQTEDRGAPLMQIETQIFHAGAILDTRIVSYEDMIKNESNRDVRNKSIKTLMQHTHRELYKNLFSGGYDHYVGLEPLGNEEMSQVEEQVDGFTPSQERVPDTARELEEKGEGSFDIKEGGDHIDLQALKNRLAKLSGPSEAQAPESDPEEDVEELATQVVGDLDVMPQIVQSAKSSNKAPESGALKPVLSLSKKGDRSTSSAPTLSVKNAAVEEDDRKSSPSTGVMAWQGCLPPREDLSLLPLIEALLK